MAATNYSVFRPKHVDLIRFGNTVWSAAQFASGTSALDTSFSNNNSSILFDAVGTRDANSPVKSEAFAKSIVFSGNERSFSEENLLGAKTTGSQNQELGENNTSQLQITLTCVYRNNIPFSIFNDTTKACIMSLDNEEATATGIVNFAFNNIKVTHVGSISLNPEGMMEQQIKFTLSGGTSGTATAVTQASPSETWVRYAGGDYAEEVRLT